jgi:hypothetical protein
MISRLQSRAISGAIGRGFRVGYVHLIAVEVRPNLIARYITAPSRSVHAHRDGRAGFTSFVQKISYFVDGDASNPCLRPHGQILIEEGKDLKRGTTKNLSIARIIPPYAYSIKHTIILKFGEAPFSAQI